MTKKEWLACTDPRPMLDFLSGKVSDRKLRLFAGACCRRIWHLLKDERSRKAVEVSEEYADDTASKEKLLATFPHAWDAAETFAHPPDAAEAARFEMIVDESGLASAVSAAAEMAARATGANPFQDESGCYDYNRSAIASEFRKQSDLLRCIFSPYHAIALNTTCLITIVTPLAQSIYTDRAFDRLPVLADALEEAGCTDADILAHCRQQGDHVRGCWVVDAVLGNS